MNKSLRKAFTLLELLVVMGIISVLIALGSVSYSTAQKKVRDAKRRDDMKKVQNCLEQFYTYNNNFVYTGSLSTGAGPLAGQTLTCGSATNTMPAPVDPINTAPLVYTVTTAAAGSYLITCNLEGSATGATFAVFNMQ